MFSGYQLSGFHCLCCYVRARGGNWEIPSAENQQQASFPKCTEQIRQQDSCGASVHQSLGLVLCITRAANWNREEELRSHLVDDSYRHSARKGPVSVSSSSYDLVCDLLFSVIINLSRFSTLLVKGLVCLHQLYLTYSLSLSCRYTDFHHL